MPSAKYCGTFTDYSGYGQANRNFIVSLFLSQVQICTELIVQVAERGKFGWAGELCKSLEEKKIPYNIKIIHLTPDCYPTYMEKGKYHIGHLFWETDKLPKEWVAPCNLMNEIWTASEAQAKMMQNSGVIVPIYWFPQPIDLIHAEKATTGYSLRGFKGFVFYSIFQWIERKNPKALIEAFWEAFADIEDVCLLLKTYRLNYSPTEFQIIEDDIHDWKKALGKTQYPPVFVYPKLMTTDEMFRFHTTGDAYINASRGEGWCIPAVEAGLMGKPIIGINTTGFADYLPKDHYYACATERTEVTEQRFIPWYKHDQQWLEISKADLVKNMRTVYNEYSQAQKVGKKAQEFIRNEFNYWTVGQKMKERLAEIEKSL